MNIFIKIVISSLVLVSSSTFARVVDIDVHGMTCPFCVDSLERKFGKMDHVSKVQVSLKNNKVRLETDDNLPSIDSIKKAILDTGFTPLKVEVKADDKH